MIYWNDDDAQACPTCGHEPSFHVPAPVDPELPQIECRDCQRPFAIAWVARPGADGLEN